MTCVEARDQFSALVDGALSREERAALDVHLAACPECPPELARFRGTVSLLASVERERAPVGFVDRVLHAAVPAPWYRRLWPRAVLPLPVKLPLEVAALVIVSVGVVYLFQRTPELRQATRLETPAPERDATSSSAAPSIPPRGQSSARATASAPRDPRPTQRPSASAGSESANEPASPPAPPPSRARETEIAERGTPKAPEPTAKDSTEGARATTESRSVAEPEHGATRALAPPAALPPPVPPSPAAPATAPPASALRRAAPEAAAPRGAPQRAPTTAASPDVTARLLVIDRFAAERAVAELAPRHRGAVVGRRADADTTIIELVVPRATYPALVRELTSLGRLLPEPHPESLPDEVRLGLRIVTD